MSQSGDPVKEPTVVLSSSDGCACLSYLGVGAQPPTPDWGAMLWEAQPYMRRVPTLTLIPGAAIFITALSVTLLGQRMMLHTQLRTRA